MKVPPGPKTPTWATMREQKEKREEEDLGLGSINHASFASLSQSLSLFLGSSSLN